MEVIGFTDWIYCLRLHIKYSHDQKENNYEINYPELMSSIQRVHAI